jgi:hypothetical protein
MATPSRLGLQLTELIASLDGIGVRFALIGGLALATLRVVSAEGLIGFKLQALGNDPSRTQDIGDIRALLRANRDSLNLEEVREYFRLFKREDWLDELINDIE